MTAVAINTHSFKCYRLWNLTCLISEQFLSAVLETNCFLRKHLTLILTNLPLIFESFFHLFKFSPPKKNKPTGISVTGP